MTSQNHNKLAVAYYRVSTDSQRENTSIGEQEEKVLAFCKSQSMEVVAKFEDVASGGNIDRDGYQDALQYMVDYEVNAFVVAKFDRAHRHQQNLLNFEADLRKKDIAFVSVAELIDTSTPTGKLLFQLLGSFAEFEREQINERTQSGRVSQAKKGKSGQRIPLGYNRDWSIVYEDAKRIKAIFLQYSRGSSQSEIAKKYHYSRQRISLMLRNDAYLGVWRYSDGEIVITDHHEAIISKNLFGRVRTRLASEKRRGKAAS